jgi:uncharacterized repeat protein (TIGR03803 family)
MRISKSIILCLALAIPALTQNQPTVTILATFPLNANGYSPGQLMQGGGGNFYGADYRGGSNGLGSIFRMTPQGALKILFSFDGATGMGPGGQLVEGRDGYLYGTTVGGGARNSGTAFKMRLDGTLQTLHTFCQQSGCADGALPNAGLIRGLDGSYYGTTSYFHPGVAFRIGPQGTYAILHRFNHAFEHLPNGLGKPSGPLLQASDGNLYGISLGGGPYRPGGAIFTVTPQGQAKLFHVFGAVKTEGTYPAEALIQAADGDLYGVTISGGAYGGGVVFKISLQGSYQKIYDFPAGGHQSYGGVIQASDGNLWGVMTGGRVFAITTSGSLIQNLDMLSLFGIYPAPTAFLQGSDGKLYGGGATVAKRFVIYTIDAGLAPPAPSIAGFLPTSGLVGSEVVVSGASYVGATGVAFNGVSAQFVVNTSGVITTTVPRGASSGPIQVTTPGGTVTSQTDFTVLP